MSTTDKNAVDRFSPLRMLMLARYFRTPLRRQATVYAAVSAILGVVCLASPGNCLLLMPFTAAVVWIMLVCGPLVFAARDTLVIDVALPATAAEKSVFIMIWSFVAVPLVVGVPLGVCAALAWGGLVKLPAWVPLFAEMVLTYLRACAPYHLLALGVLMSVCMLCVIAFCRRRMLRATLVVAGAWMLLALSGLIGFAVSMRRLYAQGFVGHKVITVDNNEEIYIGLRDFIEAHPDSIGSGSVYGFAECVVLGVVLVALLVSVYRRMIVRQI